LGGPNHRKDRERGAGTAKRNTRRKPWRSAPGFTAAQSIVWTATTSAPGGRRRGRTAAVSGRYIRTKRPMTPSNFGGATNVPRSASSKRTLAAPASVARCRAASNEDDARSIPTAAPEGSNNPGRQQGNVSYATAYTKHVHSCAKTGATRHVLRQVLKKRPCAAKRRASSSE
jgi:hypothetical protein